MIMKPISPPPIAQAIKIYEARLGFRIRTDRHFYQKIEINPKRFGLLLKGQLEPTVDELKRVSKAFDIPILDLL